jgi:hypothetical protein
VMPPPPRIRVVVVIVVGMKELSYADDRDMRRIHRARTQQHEYGQSQKHRRLKSTEGVKAGRKKAKE